MAISILRYPSLFCAALLGLSPVSGKSPEDFLASPGAKTDSQPAKAAAPAPSKAPRPAMDTVKLHATYLDGDFDQAIRVMETALKTKKSTLTHADSVFIYKHLGVMYAATPATREKGRHYMAQLISIEPTAKILDMYASDMIYLIFRNVQEEFENKHAMRPAAAAPPAADTAPVPAPPSPAALPAPAPSARQASPRSNTLYWVAGGAAIAAGAAGLLYILLDDPQPSRHDIVMQE